MAEFHLVKVVVLVVVLVVSADGLDSLRLELRIKPNFINYTCGFPPLTGQIRAMMQKARCKMKT